MQPPQSLDATHGGEVFPVSTTSGFTRMPAVRWRPHFRSLGAKLTHQKEGPGRPDALDVGGTTIYKPERSRREIAELLAHLDATWHPM
jgi:hypothetical protein